MLLCLWFNHFLDSRAEIHRIFALFFLENLRHSEINWPLKCGQGNGFDDNCPNTFPAWSDCCYDPEERRFIQNIIEHNMYEQNSSFWMQLKLSNIDVWPTNILHFQSYYQIWVDAMELNLLMIVVLLQIFVEKVKEIVTMTLTVLEPWNVAATIVSVLFLLILNVAMTLINKIEYSIFTNYCYIP